MSQKKYKNIIIENVLIEDYAAEGKSIAKINDLVYFIDNAVPGDVADIRIQRKKRNFAEATAVKFHKFSEFRTEAFCKHFGTCGGCKWQNLELSKQLYFKQKQVVDNIERIGKVKDFEVLTIALSPESKFYRNKLEYTFTNRRWFTNEEMHTENRNENGLGFHMPGMFDRVLDIQNCYLQPEPSNSIRLAIRDFAFENNYTFYSPREHTGLLRNLIIRTTSVGETMVLFSFSENNVEMIEMMLNYVSEKFPEITSLLYAINPQVNDSLYNYTEIITYKGNSHIIEKLGDLKFRIGPKSFFQTNTNQAFEMYKAVLEFAGLSGSEIVYDLYTGTGTIANFIASNAKKVVGIEYVDEAVKDAEINSELNSITNCTFLSGDMKDILTEDIFNIHGNPDVIITDPPRAGMHKDVIDVILKSNAKKIVYVSCNPATQARDIELLGVRYKLIKIQPIDMFPHTHHVENIAFLEIFD
ncbi:MAG: 23S rRNA (uracil-5-)-methyltransferase RumA [Bacteroidetes bacterium GWA2_31_9]|nr:MAG: 23S rRNA (uracil-5-)-methyltransferase RumA [Bacteroidetes bacterium GWA2_31_9]